MENKKITIQLATPERYYTRCYHDFMDCNLLTGEEKIIFLVLKRFLDVQSNNGNVFPTIETIQEMTGWGKQKIINQIKILEQKGIVKKTRQGLNRPNIYILSDYPEMWTCDSVEDMATIADNKGVKPLTPTEHIAELERMGYKVEIKEKGLETEPSKAQNQAPDNHVENDSINESKSQVKQRYTMEDVNELFEYENLTIQYPEKQTDIDIVFSILYDTLNNQKPTVRVDGQDKPTMVVIGKLMKLESDDIIYAINQFHEQTDRIRNVSAYLLTILYHAKEQAHLDLMNLGHHNGDF